MRKVFRAHLAYLLTKTNLLILFFVLLLSFLGFSEAGLALDAEELPRMNNLYFFENSFFLLKLIAAFTSIFTFSHAFSKRSDQYSELFFVRGVSRSGHFFSKIIILSVYIVYFLLLEFALYLVSGSIFLERFSPYARPFIRLYWLSLYYGFLGLAFMQIFKNIYSVILPFILFIAGMIINENEGKFRSFYNLLFPNFLSDKPEFLHGWLHMLMLASLLLFNLWLYLSRDS